MIIPISLHFSEYANQIRNRLETLGFYSDVDLTTLTFNKKIREAQLAQYNYILVVGEEEERSSSVDVRTRDNKRHGKKSVDEMIEIFTNLCETYALDSDLSNLLETSKDESESVISIDEPDNEFL
jgi:threonyl-tRNA synthetase